MSDWGSAKGMYNYSLMNNASRILLISHTRPKCSNCSRQDKHVHMYIHMYTHTHSSAVLQCLGPDLWLRPPHASTDSSWNSTFSNEKPVETRETTGGSTSQSVLSGDSPCCQAVVKLVVSAGEFTLFLKPCVKSQEQSQDVGLNMHQWWHQWMMSSPQNLVRMKAMDGWMAANQSKQWQIEDGA